MVAKVEMEEIKRNIEMESNSDIDIGQPMRDTDDDRVIEMDVAAEVDRIIDRIVEQDDLDENAKMILNNVVEKLKDPMNLNVVNPRNVDSKNVKEKDIKC